MSTVPGRPGDLDAEARALAPALVGLSIEAAQRTVDGVPGLSVLFVHPGREYFPIHICGQIWADVVDGTVTRTSPTSD